MPEPSAAWGLPAVSGQTMLRLTPPRSLPLLLAACLLLAAPPLVRAQTEPAETPASGPDSHDQRPSAGGFVLFDPDSVARMLALGGAPETLFEGCRQMTLLNATGDERLTLTLQQNQGQEVLTDYNLARPQEDDLGEGYAVTSQTRFSTESAITLGLDQADIQSRLGRPDDIFIDGDLLWFSYDAAGIGLGTGEPDRADSMQVLYGFSGGSLIEVSVGLDCAIP